MRWLKVADAAQEWVGGVNVKTLYAAIRAGHLRAARIGAGRNLLLCEEYIDEWLRGRVDARQDFTGVPPMHRRRAG